jgi:hypothetical protein
MSLNAGGGRVAGYQPRSKAIQYTGAQINLGDLTPYLTYSRRNFVFRVDETGIDIPQVNEF